MSDKKLTTSVFIFWSVAKHVKTSSSQVIFVFLLWPLQVLYKLWVYPITSITKKLRKDLESDGLFFVSNEMEGTQGHLI